MFKGIGRCLAQMGRFLVRCLVIIGVLEGASFLLLGAIALRGGHASSYFRTLLPHPALSRRTQDIALQSFHLLSHEGHASTLFRYGAAGVNRWHPQFGYYRPYLFGRPRDVSSFEPQALNVYILGGSTVEGGATERLTTAARIQDYLQARLQDRYQVRVINEGVSGGLSVTQLGLLTAKILPFGNPHYVVAFDGYNDWLTTAVNLINDFKTKTAMTEELWPRTELSWHFYWFEQRAAMEAINTIPGAFKQLVGVTSKQVLSRSYTGWFVSHLRNWVRYKLMPRYLGTAPPKEYFSQAGFERIPILPRERAAFQVVNERIMAEACRARGCRFFWVLQPILPCRGEAMTAQERENHASRPSVFWRSLERYNQDLREIVQEGAAFWAPSFLDLSCPAADVPEGFISDTAHLTAAGQARSAEYIAALILEDMEERGGKPPEVLAAVKPAPFERAHAEARTELELYTRLRSERK